MLLPSVYVERDRSFPFTETVIVGDKGPTEALWQGRYKPPWGCTRTYAGSFMIVAV